MTMSKSALELWRLEKDKVSWFRELQREAYDMVTNGFDQRPEKVLAWKKKFQAFMDANPGPMNEIWSGYTLKQWHKIYKASLP